MLDLAVVNAGSTTAEALAATTALAQRADELGYHRFWVAEHHNMPLVASTTPPVLMAHLAARTTRIRVGSGGIMLPNHAPLVVVFDPQRGELRRLLGVPAPERIAGAVAAALDARRPA